MQIAIITSFETGGYWDALARAVVAAHSMNGEKEITIKTLTPSRMTTDIVIGREVKKHEETPRAKTELKPEILKFVDGSDCVIIGCRRGDSQIRSILEFGIEHRTLSTDFPIVLCPKRGLTTVVGKSNNMDDEATLFAYNVAQYYRRPVNERKNKRRPA